MPPTQMSSVRFCTRASSAFLRPRRSVQRRLTALAPVVCLWLNCATASAGQAATASFLQVPVRSQYDWAMGQAPGKPTGPAFAEALKKTEAKKSEDRDLATFAAGCFWGVELAFQRLPGVIKTRVGYIGGSVKDPTYKQVCSGTTGHAEAVEITFDPAIVTYQDLLNVFWERHDPTTRNRQGNDVGTQYRSGIFYHSEAQKKLAEESKEAYNKVVINTVVTEITPASTFYAAEDYHQQYLQKGGQSATKGDATPIRCYG